MYPMGTIIKKTNHHHNYHHRHQQQVDRILQLINEIADRSAAWRRTRTKTTAFEDKRDGSKQPVKGSRRNSCHKNINTVPRNRYIGKMALGEKKKFANSTSVSSDSTTDKVMEEYETKKKKIMVK